MHYVLLLCMALTAIIKPVSMSTELCHREHLFRELLAPAAPACECMFGSTKRSARNTDVCQALIYVVCSKLTQYNLRSIQSLN